MRILALLLSTFGVLLTLATFPAIYWLVVFACGMGTAGCRQSGTALFAEFILSHEAWMFWVPLATGLALVCLGWRMRVAIARGCGERE
ncbi:hypothetical protein [Paenirhodobacter populi]|uniref:Uncharacterized protein n=1 Tax=Paenirhodobacter populi TaxID=2306993 RepID=A0A443JN56_9RHOB|nr:hypothetical protein [Sinirhodobacter populi]RWR21913.1 hypothetical protein D2T30_07840 [Sinirhodobacter populi]